MGEIFKTLNYKGLKYGENFTLCLGFADEKGKQEMTVVTEFHPNCESISMHAFEESNIKKIDMSKTNIKSIGNSAFLRCKNLTEVIFSDKITRIGDSAFAGCLNLKAIELPDSVQFIGEGVFKDTKIEEINLPENIINVGMSDFFVYTNGKWIMKPYFKWKISNMTQGVIKAIAKCKLCTSIENINKCFSYDKTKYDVEKLALEHIKENVSIEDIDDIEDEYEEDVVCTIYGDEYDSALET